MRVKTVYGKKVKRSAPLTTSSFTWSSPDKSPSKLTNNEGNENETVAITVADVALKDDKRAITDTQRHDRTALGTRDANSVVQPKALQPSLSCEVEKSVRRSPRLKNRQCTPDSNDLVFERSPTRRPRSPLVSAETLDQGALDGPTTSLRGEKQERQDSAVAQDQKELDTKQEDGNRDHSLLPLLDLVTDPIQREAPISFSAWTADLEVDFTISKIAEATFAQVYLLQRKEPTGDPREDQSVLKAISLNPVSATASAADERPPKVRETSSDISKVISEIKLLDRMTEIPGFTNLREVSVLSGQPSAPFVAAWKEWNKKRRKNEKSYFPDPSRKANYDETQLWAIVEMDHAGFDLEHPETKIDDIEGLWDVFWGVAITLAKGEEDVKFEHRDLHLGNVCVTKKDPTNPQEHCSHQCQRKFGNSGLETTIIDYTLSRAEITSAGDESETVCVDLEKEGIFDGDASTHYQYDLYRHMRSAVFLDDPLRDSAVLKDSDNHTSWRDSHLETNIIWLHFMLHELWPKVPNTVRSSGAEDPGQQPLLESRMKNIKTTIESLVELLLLKNWHSHGLRSAKDLVLLALENGWLDPEDVSGDMTDVDEVATMISKLDLVDHGLGVQSHDAEMETEDSKAQKPRKGRRKDP